MEPAEAEQALSDPERIGVSAYNVKGERRWASLGATEAGRILFVVYTHRRVGSASSRRAMRQIATSAATGREGSSDAES